jgi:hypothetical protein
MARNVKAKDDAVETPPPATPPARSGSRFLRLFLMIAGGLAAPCLALAAFFLSGQSHDTKKVAQPGRITTTTRPAGSTTPSPGRVAPAPTTTTTAPVTSAAGLRDPFAPLVK